MAAARSSCPVAVISAAFCCAINEANARRRGVIVNSLSFDVSDDEADSSFIISVDDEWVALCSDDDDCDESTSLETAEGDSR